MVAILVHFVQRLANQLPFYDNNDVFITLIKVSFLWPHLLTKSFSFKDSFLQPFFPIIIICGASSEFVSSNIPSWQILTAHAQAFRGARDLAFCLKVPLDSLLVWASSGGSGETAHMRKLAWTFAAGIGHKYNICLTRPIYKKMILQFFFVTYWPFVLYYLI